MLAQEITDLVMSDLTDRKGMLDDVEPDVQQEMAAELKAKIENLLNESFQAGSYAEQKAKWEEDFIEPEDREEGDPQP